MGITNSFESAYDGESMVTVPSSLPYRYILDTSAQTFVKDKRPDGCIATLDEWVKYGEDMKTLPNLPSKLILLALKDLRLVEQDPRYTVHMDTWHCMDYSSVCSVCLAGAVMAKSLDATHGQWYAPFIFEESDRLEALNLFREGYISEGLYRLGYKLHEFDSRIQIEVPRYEDGPLYFRYFMMRIAYKFKGLGL